METVSRDRFGYERLDFANVLVVDTQHDATIEWQALREFDECLFKTCKIVTIRIHMVGIDIGNDFNDRIQIQERRIRFIRFRDDKITGTQTGIGSRTVQTATDNEGRIETAFR